MSDTARGRQLVLISLVVIVALTIGLAALPASSSAAVRFGRPLIVILAAALVFQGRGWARWLLVLLGLGILLAGPIAWGNNLPPWTMGGALFWLASILYAASLIILFASKDVRAYLASRSSGGPGQPSTSAGA